MTILDDRAVFLCNLISSKRSHFYLVSILRINVKFSSGHDYYF